LEEQQKQNLGTYSSYLDIYNDKEYKNKAGYLKYLTSRNLIDTKNFILNVEGTLYFSDNIIQYEYTRKNNDDVNTPILFWNKWDGKTNPIGVVTRIIQDNELIRKLIIDIN
jgi:hypothetical protein